MILRLMKQGNGADRIRTPRGFGADVIAVNPRKMPGFPGTSRADGSVIPVDGWFKGDAPTDAETKAFTANIRTRLHDQLAGRGGAPVCVDEERFDQYHGRGREWQGRNPDSHNNAVLVIYKAITDGLHSLGLSSSFWDVPRLYPLLRGTDTIPEMLNFAERYQTRQLNGADMIVVAAYWGDESEAEFLYAVAMKMVVAQRSAKGRPVAFCTVPLGKHDSTRAWRPIPTSTIIQAFEIARIAGASEGWLWVNGSQGGALAPIYNLWFRYRAWKLLRDVGGPE